MSGDCAGSDWRASQSHVCHVAWFRRLFDYLLLTKLVRRWARLCFFVLFLHCGLILCVLWNRWLWKIRWVSEAKNPDASIKFSRIMVSAAYLSQTARRMASWTLFVYFSEQIYDFILSLNRLLLRDEWSRHVCESLNTRQAHYLSSLLPVRMQVSMFFSFHILSCCQAVLMFNLVSDLLASYFSVCLFSIVWCWLILFLSRGLLIKQAVLGLAILPGKVAPFWYPGLIKFKPQVLHVKKLRVSWLNRMLSIWSNFSTALC